MSRDDNNEEKQVNCLNPKNAVMSGFPSHIPGRLNNFSDAFIKALDGISKLYANDNHIRQSDIDE